MTIDNHVNYVDTYFEYKTLTKIHGEPSYEGIKKNKDDLDHFLGSLEKHYEYHFDPTGSHYIGLSLNWDYPNQTVELSMPKYVDKLLHRIGHPKPKSPQLSPHEYLPYIVGEKGARQYAALEDHSPPLDAKQTTHVQSVVGGLLYYARAIDHTILPALSTISTMQARPTANTLKKINRLPDYVATFPHVCLRYRASNMILHTDSDAAYLVEQKAKSRAAGFHNFKFNTLHQR